MVKRRITMPRSRASDDGEVGQKVSSFVRTGVRKCLKQAKVSVRRAPKIWGCSKATVERDLKKGFEIRPLRSSLTAECFLLLMLDMIRARDRRRTAGYVVRAHDHNVSRLREQRNAERPSRKRVGSKRDT
jgi:hypothetical protein